MIVAVCVWFVRGTWRVAVVLVRVKLVCWFVGCCWLIVSPFGFLICWGVIVVRVPVAFFSLLIVMRV